MPYRTGDGTNTDQFGVQLATGAIGARFDFMGRERQGTQPAPTSFVIGAAAGTGAVVTSHTGTDNVGNVVITTGTSPGVGTLVTVTFAIPYTGTNPPIVQIEAKDTGATALVYATCTNTQMLIKCAATAPTSVQMAFDYVIICGA